MPMDNQCRLCGQLMGVVQFTGSVFDSYPVLFRFNNEKVAIKHVGKYSFVSIVIIIIVDLSISQSFPVHSRLLVPTTKGY